MKSIDSPYLLQISYRLSLRGPGDNDNDDDETRRVTYDPFAGPPCACSRASMRPVYLHTGAHRSLRAIKHESRVTFIPLWGVFRPESRKRFLCRSYPLLPSLQPFLRADFARRLIIIVIILIIDNGILYTFYKMNGNEREKKKMFTQSRRRNVRNIFSCHSWGFSLPNSAKSLSPWGQNANEANYVMCFLYCDK